MVKNIREFRQRADLTQGELAARLNVTPSLVSRWEKGERQPSADQVMEIARALGVSLDYLLNADVRTRFEFRARSHATTTDDEARTLLDAEMQVHYLLAGYQLASTLPPTFALRLDYNPTQLRETAHWLRDFLKLNQHAMHVELKQALAEQHVFVFEWHMPRSISGLSYRGALSAIFVNKQHDAERRLFTLAHELAHVLFHLGRGGTETAVSTFASNRDPQEKEANAFAAELLMPTDAVNVVIQHYGPQLKETLVLDSVARAFNVSRDAMFYRLANFGVFSWADKTRYFTAAPAEPAPKPARVTDLDQQIPTEFLQLALRLYAEEQVSAGKLREWFFALRSNVDDYLADHMREAEAYLEF